jgi:GSH-dependent disulfide-bond oxidoreductase
LAEKTGKLIPKDPVQSAQVIQWLFWQVAGFGPMWGQFGHFYVYAPETIPYAIERYTDEARRLLAVLDKQLDGRDFIGGDEFSIADIALSLPG